MNKNKLKVILVDDEEEANKYLSSLLLENNQLEIIGCYNDPALAIENIITHKPELLFLDVQMPAMNGFELLQSVTSETYMPMTVFVTAYEKYAIPAIKNSAFDYLLKPVIETELEQTIARVLKHKSQNNYSTQLSELIAKLNKEKKIKFNTSTGFVLVDIHEIIYCEAHRNYCEIYLTDSRREVVTNNLNNVHKMLPEDEFFRISRFHVINLDFLVKAERKSHTCLLSENGNKIILKVSSDGFKRLESFYQEF